MPLIVRKLAEQLEKKFASSSERSLLVRSASVAESCRAFLFDKTGAETRIIALCRLDFSTGSDIFMVIFPEMTMPIATYFWQHTGLGISSRFAEQYLGFLAGIEHPSHPASLAPKSLSALVKDTYQQDIPYKHILRQRIVSLITHSDSCVEHVGRKSSCIPLNEDDVFIYPTGMSAIWYAHQLLLNAIGTRESVCFGFPYTDTLKILRKWGPGCHFYPDGDQTSIERLEAMLSSQRVETSEPPILALFTEFPSNPLLRSVNLPHLRALADEYGFLIVVDDTVGNFVNVDVLPFADIVVSSLTKIFSGCANVMGGSLTLNPCGKCYAVLKRELQRTWEDVYFNEDARIMEHNSRSFCDRVARIDYNAEVICDYLRGCADIIAEVYYPKWETRELYDACRSRFTSGRTGGFGGLFSLSFSSPRAAHAFFDALDCAKGPSLGTNFTLACPYALFAHWEELDWAERHGVSRDIVRVSTGIEDAGRLLDAFAVAVRAARKEHASSPGMKQIASTKL
ncbi:hypothetical protein EIP86_001387 [Pleurotus ostreatoroseus]|nr:hypothetical protein EIP86_001387 [Pleurotus ostreatoroseus]